MKNENSNYKLAFGVILTLINPQSLFMYVFPIFGLYYIYTYVNQLEERNLFVSKIYIIWISIFITIFLNSFTNELMLLFATITVILVMISTTYNLIKLLNVYLSLFVNNNLENEKTLSKLNKNLFIITLINYLFVILKIIPVVALVSTNINLINIVELILSTKFQSISIIIHIILLWIFIRPYQNIYNKLHDEIV